MLEIEKAAQGPRYNRTQSGQQEAAAAVATSIGGESNSRDSLGHTPVSNTGKPCNMGFSFNGKTRLYTIKTFRSGSEHGFVERVDAGHFQSLPEFAHLVGTIQALYCGVYPERVKRNPELTRERVLQSLSLQRTLVQVAFDGDIPVGYGIFPRLDADNESVIYSSRAILAEHVREGIGTYMLEQAILRHKKEAARWGRPLDELFLMTQRWESVRSLKKLQARGLIEKIQPFDEPYDPRGLRLLYIVHSQVRLNSTGIDQTGRSAGELSEVGHNENFTRPDPEENPEGAELFDKITKSPPKGAGINPFNGDELYVRCILAKQPPPSIKGEAFSGK